MTGRILVVEDNADLAFGLVNNLEIEGYAVDVASDGAAGVRRAREAAPDLVILDLMLPKLDGFRVLRALRDGAFAGPVLILTARGEEADKVKGLKLGADDYVTKPFGLLELLARVEALLRRRPAAPGPRGEDVFRFGGVELRPRSRIVTKNGRVVELAPKELDLLLALWRRRGEVVSRNDLLRDVWNYSDAAVTRTVDTHIGELRRKLEDEPSSPRHILTARKAGYRLEP
ncbi:MAG: response regulator transcription factor [Acidobacteriota bacterium]